MSKEAMKLALEALEVATTPLAKDRQEVLRAITALQEALAEQPAIKQDLTPEQPAQQEPVGEIGKIVMFGGDLKEVSWKNGKMPPAGSILYTRPQAREPEQPAQQQQEPYEIEWPEYHEHAMGCGLEDRDERCRYGAMRYGWDCAIEAVAQAMPDVIYTSPPASKPLTDEELVDVASNCGMNGLNIHGYTFARAIEAAHGIREKNT